MENLRKLYEKAISEMDCGASFEQFTINDLQFHAVTAGPKEGKLLLLLHGFPECWYSWRKQIPFFANQGYRVVAPDLRGYGLNEKPEEIAAYQITHLVEDIRQIIIKQRAESAIVVAHDWGGAAAWNFAMWSPEMVERLIILNSPHPVTFARELRDRSGEQYKMSWYMRFFQKPSWPERLLTADFDRTAKWFLIDKWGHDQAYIKEDLALYSASYAVPGSMSAMLNWYRAAFKHRSSTRPKNTIIEVPTLVLWGENDQALSLKLLDGLQEWVPNLEIKRFQNAGHFLQNDAPDEVNEAISSVLNKPLSR